MIEYNQAVTQCSTNLHTNKLLHVKADNFIFASTMWQISTMKRVQTRNKPAHFSDRSMAKERHTAQDLPQYQQECGVSTCGLIPPIPAGWNPNWTSAVGTIKARGHELMAIYRKINKLMAICRKITGRVETWLL